MSGRLTVSSFSCPPRRPRSHGIALSTLSAALLLLAAAPSAVLAQGVQLGSGGNGGAGSNGAGGA
ncbi:MAG: hypothetical protein ACT6SU_39485, partial [Variovorax sp.]